jgi:ketosteroid isomerase-like protein
VSQSNVEVVHALLERWNAGDHAVLTEYTTSDFAFFPALDRTVEGDSYRGREGIERYFEMVSDTWEELHVLGDEIRDLGDRVLVLGRVEGRGRGSGVQVDAPAGIVVDFRGGKMSRVRAYLDRGEALRAAGLAE